MKFKKEIEKLIKNVDKIPEEFWSSPIYNWSDTEKKDKTVCWFMDRQKPSVEQSWDFDEERFGITREGEIIWGFDSGCSCPSPWEDGDEYTTKTWKEFQADPETAFDADWQDECYAKMKIILEKI